MNSVMENVLGINMFLVSVCSKASEVLFSEKYKGEGIFTLVSYL